MFLRLASGSHIICKLDPMAISDKTYLDPFAREKINYDADEMCSAPHDDGSDCCCIAEKGPLGYDSFTAFG